MQKRFVRTLLRGHVAQPQDYNRLANVRKQLCVCVCTPPDSSPVVELTNFSRRETSNTLFKWFGMLLWVILSLAFHTPVMNGRKSFKLYPLTTFPYQDVKQSFR